jgi:O-antigen/teichoic acid export membrane protein
MTMAAPLARSRRAAVANHLSDPLYRNAYALAFNSAATGAAGVLYWILAARLFPSADVGRDATLVAAITALSGFAQLNFTMTLPRLIPPSRHPRRWILRAYGSSSVLAVVLGIGFIVVAPNVSDSWSYLRDSPAFGALFVVSLAMFGVFAIQDAALSALGRATVVPASNLVFGIAKIAFAIGLGMSIEYGHSVFISWVVPMIAVMVPVNVILFRAADDAGRRARRTLDPPPPREPGLVRNLTIDYLAGVTWLAYWGGVPLLVLANLGETPAAYFNVAFAIGTALAAVSQAMATSLTVEASRDTSQLVPLARRSLRRIVLIVAPGAIAAALATPLILAPFGTEYAEHSSMALRLLCLAAVPAALTNMAMAVARVKQQAVVILAIRILTSGLGLSLAWLAVRSGSLTTVASVWYLTDIVVAAACSTYLIAQLRHVPTTARDDTPAPAAAWTPAWAPNQVDAWTTLPPESPTPPRRRRLPARPRLLRRGHVSRNHRIAHGFFYLIGLAASAWVALDGPEGPVRTTLVVATMLLLPGGLVIGRTGIDELLSEVAFGVGLSLAAWVVGAQIMLATHDWGPDALLIVITTISAVVWLAEPSERR